MKSFSSLKLDHLQALLQGLRVQQEVQDQPRKVTDYHFCNSIPKTRHSPQLYGLSRGALALLGLEEQAVRQDSDSPLFLSGSKLMPGSRPSAHNYCGYQFGVWAGQLGDGRAHMLGSASHGGKRYELQLKGSGVTPFSRHADGNSVLSSAVREFLASELMSGLQVPTTRAVSLVVANEPVKRDPFYNGSIKVERAAIVLRISETFFRFGSLEVCLPTGQMHRANPLENRKILQPICDYVIQQHFPSINPDEEDPYQELFKRLVKHSAELVAQWQSIGFCHGVLNTDNMSLGGVTIDYGPFAFIDYFSKDFVSNASDDHERYSFRRQPRVVEWNLERLAEAMDPLIPHSLSLKYLKSNYQRFYEDKYYSIMSGKLGIQNSQQSRSLIDSLIEVMHHCGTHYTNFFTIIEEHSKQKWDSQKLISALTALSQPAEFYLKTLRAFPQLINVDVSSMLKQDSAFNNFFIEEQQQRVKMLQSLTHQSCKDRSLRQEQLWREWAAKYLELRSLSTQKSISNPKYVLLNFIAKQIIQELEVSTAEESLQLLSKVLEVLSNPGQTNEWFEQKYWRNPPVPVKLTCSS